MLNSSLLQRLRNNFMVVEVWNRIGPHDHADQVINFLFHLIIKLFSSRVDCVHPCLNSILLKISFIHWFVTKQNVVGLKHSQLK